MKLYISGPMTGLPDFNRPAFRQVQAELESLNPIAQVEVVSPIDNPPPPAADYDEGQEWRWYMAKALEQLLSCDGVVLLDHWSDSPGACAERAVAIAAGIPAWPTAVWLELEHRAFLAPRPLAFQAEIEGPATYGRQVFDVWNIRRPGQARP